MPVQPGPQKDVNKSVWVPEDIETQRFAKLGLGQIRSLGLFEILDIRERIREVPVPRKV